MLQKWKYTGSSRKKHTVFSLCFRKKSHILYRKMAIFGLFWGFCKKCTKKCKIFPEFCTFLHIFANFRKNREIWHFWGKTANLAKIGQKWRFLAIFELFRRNSQIWTEHVFLGEKFRFLFWIGKSSRVKSVTSAQPTRSAHPFDMFYKKRPTARGLRWPEW